MERGAGGRRVLVAAAVAASVLAVASITIVSIIAIQEAGDAALGGAGAITYNATATNNVSNIASGGIVEHSISNYNVNTDIVMPTKVSRPGCEQDDTCYLPASYFAAPGEPITWTNEDSAFHTVTSGTYDAPLELFDSGFMDPYESYVISFEEPGVYEYYCTLHPWMEGTITIVQSS